MLTSKIKLPTSKYGLIPSLANEDYFLQTLNDVEVREKIIRRSQHGLETLKTGVEKGSTSHPQPRVYVTSQHIFYRIRGSIFLKVSFGSKFATISNGKVHRRYKYN